MEASDLDQALALMGELGTFSEPVTVVSRQYDDPNGDTPLHVATTLGNEKYVKALLSAGADPNARGDLGCTPLHGAIGSDLKEITKMLLAAGARIDIQNELNLTPWDLCNDEDMKELVLRHSFPPPEQNA
jgi:ankyrin repeat protein